MILSLYPGTFEAQNQALENCDLPHYYYELTNTGHLDDELNVKVSSFQQNGGFAQIESRFQKIKEAHRETKKLLNKLFEALKAKNIPTNDLVLYMESLNGYEEYDKKIQLKIEQKKEELLFLEITH